ncbi:unnamed protein product [Colias eurytheme]|nr:unnamed protein product [Colias eurytheme]
MPNNKCPSCGKFYSPTTDGAKCFKCSHLYHKQCISPKSRLNGKWLCKTCKDSSPKSAEPECSQDVGSGDIYVDAPMQAHDSLSSSLAEEMKLLRTELSSFRQEMTKVTMVMAEYNKRLDGFEERLERMESDYPVNKSIIQPSNDIVESIESLKHQLNDSEQRNLMNDVEITGFPETKGENLLHLTITIAHKIGLSLEEKDIVNAYRVGRQNGLDMSSDRSSSGRPRPIIVKLTRHHLRNELLRAARVRRGADSGGLVAGEPRRFYINEHLTRNNRRLFHLAREQQRAKGWSYVWTRRGHIYARRDQHSKYHTISSEGDINKVFGQN